MPSVQVQGARNQKGIFGKVVQERRCRALAWQEYSRPGQTCKTQTQSTERTQKEAKLQSTQIARARRTRVRSRSIIGAS